jgi:hypothetical protein
LANYLIPPHDNAIMSIVRNQAKIEGATGIDELAKEALAAEPSLHAVDDDAAAEPGTSGILSLNLNGAFTPAQLQSGVVFNVSDYPVGALPTGKVIVSEVKSTAIGSHVAANLMVSANLFNSGATDSHYLSSGVQNSVGWVTSDEQDHLVPTGYAPVLNVLPNEYNRSDIVHYSPSSGVDDKLVQRYGHLGSGDALRQGVVSFPGEDYYYVQKDHVVLDIIEKNWEALGSSVPNERVRDGSWIKVSNTLVDRVLDELDNSVLKHMPLTNLSKLGFHIKSDQVLGNMLEEDVPCAVSLNLSVSYRTVGDDPPVAS